MAGSVPCPAVMHGPPALAAWCGVACAGAEPGIAWGGACVCGADESHVQTEPGGRVGMAGRLRQAWGTGLAAAHAHPLPKPPALRAVLRPCGSLGPPLSKQVWVGATHLCRWPGWVGGLALQVRVQVWEPRFTQSKGCSAGFGPGSLISWGHPGGDGPCLGKWGFPEEEGSRPRGSICLGVEATEPCPEPHPRPACSSAATAPGVPARPGGSCCGPGCTGILSVAA